MRLPLSRRTVLGFAAAAPLATSMGFLTDDPLQDAIASSADYRGGILALRLPNEGRDWRPGNQVSLMLRFRTSSAQVSGGLAVLRDSSGNTLLGLTLAEADGKPQLQFQLRTSRSEVPLRLGVPIELVGARRWHVVIARYSGPKVDLFIDGVLVDEEWPMGMLTPQGAVAFELGSTGYSGEISSAALWTRKLSDAEVVSLSGGAGDAAARTVEYLGEPSNHLQYWKPQGWNASAGDAMPMFDGSAFHVYYLFDRRHHKSKWGLGAHQWAHVASEDLVHWKHYPMALPITDEAEGSICTGSVFLERGKYFAFYATRKPDRSEQLCVALSDDGIHFEKVSPTPFLEPQPPYRHGPNRDPFVFLDKASSMYKMLVTAELENPPLYQRGGALELLTSRDLKQWTQAAPFLVPGYVGTQPECSCLFQWNDWYYLSFGQDGATHYRMSRNQDGPWMTPSPDILDDAQARVMKIAAFKNNRRLAVGFLAEQGFGGRLIFRELVQRADGTLGTRFPPEMIPAAGEAIEWQARPVTGNVVVNSSHVTLRSDSGLGMVAIDSIPQNVWISTVIRPSAGTTAFGVALRGKEKYAAGVELRIEPLEQRVSWRGAAARVLEEDPLASIYEVSALNRRVELEILAVDNIFDVCINGERTAIHQAANMLGNKLFLFVADGEVTVERMVIRPLL